VIATLAVAAALAAPTIAFGRVGGNIKPFAAAVDASGHVTVDGAAARDVGAARVRALVRIAQREQFFSLPRSTRCTGTLPDVAARYVRLRSAGVVRTVRVQGGCNARLTTALPTIWYHVRDLDAGRAFYRDKLGFIEVHHEENERWAELSRGGVRIALAEGEPQDGAVAAVDVDDVKADAERLRREGVDIGVVFELHEEIRLLDVFDPDGNRIQLTQELSRS
jgi:catechol 2,3-dioxygenase-like lactoylglutathione lyase family enzyme